MQSNSCGYSDKEFATIYDLCIAESFIDRIFPVVDRLVLPHIPQQARVLDLCCGTGNFASRLAYRGFQVVGLDNSHTMLERARKRAPQATFLQCDARCLALHGRFDAAFCTFNALAHFRTAEELLQIFSGVHSSLLPAGFFFFDLNAEQAYRERWHGSFGSSHLGTEWLVEPRYDHTCRTAHNRITLKKGDQAGAELNVVQHCFQQNEVAAALLASGFQQSRSFDATVELGIPDESGRLIFVSRKSA
jgi:SAM-dependent methyltransferase